MVNIVDIGLLVVHFGVMSTQPEYDLLYDLDDKNAINITDIGWVVTQFGGSC